MSVSGTTNGIVVGVVADLEDPERLGRIRVRYPNYADELSNWARVASPMAGGQRGFRFTPEVDDEVLVVFEHGDARRPYVVGALWSSTDQPPPDDGAPSDNNWRYIVSRSGHLLKLDDTPGAERVEILDQSGGLHVLLDSAADKVQVVSDRGDVEVSAPLGTVKVEANAVQIKATTDLTLEAAGTVTVKGGVVQINP